MASMDKYNITLYIYIYRMIRYTTLCIRYIIYITLHKVDKRNVLKS